MWWIFRAALVRKIAYVLVALAAAMLFGHRAHAALVYGWSYSGTSGTASSAAAAGAAYAAAVQASTVAAGCVNATYAFTGVTSDPGVAGTWSGTDHYADSNTTERGAGSASCFSSGANDTVSGPITGGATPPVGTCLAGQVTDIEMSSGAGVAGASVCGSNSCGFTLGPANTFRTYAAGGMKTSQSATGTGISCNFSATPVAQQVLPGATLDAGATVADCQASGGKTACVVQSSGGVYCGTYNGDYICVGQVAPGGCQGYSSGAAACTTNPNVSAPGQPDNGTVGSPATPSATLTDPAGNKTNYYGAATVAGSSKPAQTTGTGASGSSTGTGAGTGAAACPQGQTCTGVTDSWTGGVDCVTPPVCTNTDPVQCAQASQEWLFRCQSVTDAQLVSAIGTVTGPVNLRLDASGYISDHGTDTLAAVDLGTGTCPAPLAVTIMGHSTTLDIFAPMCRFAGFLSVIFLAVAYMVAARVMFAGAVSNTF